MQRHPDLSRDLGATEPASPLLRLPAVMRLTGLGRSTIDRLVAEQRFPGPVRLAARAVAWRRSDLELWSESRPAATQGSGVGTGANPSVTPHPLSPPRPAIQARPCSA
jgi:prophage regulatory protein